MSGGLEGTWSDFEAIYESTSTDMKLTILKRAEKNLAVNVTVQKYIL
jgi:hypothetical protein